MENVFKWGGFVKYVGIMYLVRNIEYILVKEDILLVKIWRFRCDTKKYNIFIEFGKCVGIYGVGKVIYYFNWLIKELGIYKNIDNGYGGMILRVFKENFW